MYYRAGTEHQNNRKMISSQPATSSVGSRDVFHLIIEANSDWGPFLNSSVLHKTQFWFSKGFNIRHEEMVREKNEGVLIKSVHRTEVLKYLYSCPAYCWLFSRIRTS